MRVKFFILFFLIFFSNSLYADSYREYKDVKKEISVEEANLKKVISEKRSLIDRLNAYEDSIDKSRNILRGINKDIASIESNLKSIDSEIVASEKKIAGNRSYIFLSNKFMVENIRYFPILLLLTSKSIKDSMTDIEILTIAINNMSDKISLLKVDIENLNRLKIDEVSERGNLLQFQTIQREEIERVNKLSSEEDRLLTLLKNDELARKDYISQLRAKERELDDIIKAQPVAKPDITDRKSKFGRSKGSLDMPIEGKITERFGKVYIKDAEVNIFNKGIKISVEGERFVKLPYDGVVVYANSVKGLLYIAVIQHDGGYYTVYANMNKIIVKSGDRVKRGESLGVVSDYGHLYFELRRGETAINPSGWFK